MIYLTGDVVVEIVFTDNLQNRRLVAEDIFKYITLIADWK